MNLLRDPLLHFLVIGAALFGAYHFAEADDEPAPDEIIVSAGQIASMQAIFSQTWQRPPSNEETQALINEYIHDEVIFREGVAMGLDQDDAIIRRRVRQKMEFVADLAADVEPTDDELRTFVTEHPDWFRDEPRVSFSHVYFAAGVDSPSAEEIDTLRQGLNAGTADASASGSPFMAGSEFQDVTGTTVAQTFGKDFASWIGRAHSGTWEGPVTSAYGAHLVRVVGRLDERQLPFEQVREAARREWLHQRKTAANNALYERLRSRYTVKVEDAADGARLKLAEATP